MIAWERERDRKWFILLSIPLFVFDISLKRFFFFFFCFFTVWNIVSDFPHSTCGICKTRVDDEELPLCVRGYQWKRETNDLPLDWNGTPIKGIDIDDVWYWFFFFWLGDILPSHVETSWQVHGCDKVERISLNCAIILKAETNDNSLSLSKERWSFPVNGLSFPFFDLR